MPIRADLRKHYAGEWRRVTRPRILARAGNKCENCGVPNHETVLRCYEWWTMHKWAPDVMADYISAPLDWHAPGDRHQLAYLPIESCHWVGIILTVAHLNHVAGDDRDDNLRALCQWCHLDYDKAHHAATRAARKDQGRELLVAIESDYESKGA